MGIRRRDYARYTREDLMSGTAYFVRPQTGGHLTLHVMDDETGGAVCGRITEHHVLTMVEDLSPLRTYRFCSWCDHTVDPPFPASSNVRRSGLGGSGSGRRTSTRRQSW